VLLDVHVPSGGVESGTPTILFIHGGGRYAGDKTDSPTLWMPLADEGYAVVACNYTLSTNTMPSHPLAIYDVKERI
jgi:acetyl esterase/lipase